MQLSDSEHITNAMLLQHERIAAAGVHLRLLLLRNRLSQCLLAESIISTRSIRLL